jgi:hypothetical protein
LAHSSVGDERVNGAGLASPETVRNVLARGRLIEARDGFEESGGDGTPIPAMRKLEVTLQRRLLSLTSATEGDWSGDWTREATTLVGSSPMKGGSSGVVACCVSLSSWPRPLLLAWAMSIGRAPDSLRRSSKIVRAGDGGIESIRLMGITTGLAKADEAAELARERRSSGKTSRSGLPEVRLDFQRVDMVEMWEPMRETPFIDGVSDPRFSRNCRSMPTPLSVRS